jgi:4-amino-4-deoxy-L-arabinose transferase-like glycosyltransferase
MMFLPLIVMAGIATLIAGVVGWAMALRYGRRRALVVPVLVLLAAVLSVLRASGLDPDNLLPRVAHALGFAGPAVAGALVGLALARPKER